MNIRQKILNHLTIHQRDTPPPPPWQSQRDFGDLAAQFTAALQKANGEVHRAESLEEALVIVSAVLEEIEAKTAVVNNQPPLNALNLSDRWPAVQWHIAGQTPGDLRVFCAAADIGLTGADAALAETGTVVVSSGPGLSRLTALLPPVHLALVATSQITTDLFTWTNGRQHQPPAAVTLISGPSKTADIEQTMAIGVHGPKRFIVVLYHDDEEGPAPAVLSKPLPEPTRLPAR
jgi:L-lactate dehydrogenase complex protein LldG